MVTGGTAAIEQVALALTAECLMARLVCTTFRCCKESQDWNTHISYAEDGTTVEIVLLEARASGVLPFEVLHGRAA